MKTAIKRLLPFLLLLALLSSLVTAVSATESDPLRTVGGLSPLEEAIYLGLMATEEKIDIEGLCESREELSRAIGHLLNAAPELFHVENSYSLTTVGGVPVSVIPEYRMVGRELEVARTKYCAEIEEIVETVDPDLSDYEIALYLHDYICKRYAYDVTLTHFDAYSLFSQGMGVCQAYTLAYAALLSRFDIPVTYATGKADGVSHIWSIVTLDGVSYHIDTTWGDPLRNGFDVFGLATHENFLQSDAAIEATGHTERKNAGGITATDERYRDSLLTQVTSPFAFLNGETYGMVDGSLYRFSDDLTEATLLYTVEEEWRTNGSILTTKPAGVAAWNGVLYINTPHAIVTYDLLSGTTEEYFSAGERLILGLFGNGPELDFVVADDIYGTNSNDSTYILPPAVPTCEGEHDFEVYAYLPPSCDSMGCSYLRCTVCDTRWLEESETLPHTYDITVVAPTFGSEGYTKKECRVCGDIVTESFTPALPLPTVDDYRAAVAAARDAATPEAFLAAVASAYAMEPYLDPDAVAAEAAELAALVDAYDARTAEINTDFGQALYALLPIEGDLLTPAATLLGVLLLVIRRLFGL